VGGGVPGPAPSVRVVRYFEDIVVGEELTHKGTYTLTETEIREVGERWDPQPSHIDPMVKPMSHAPDEP
jgi:acyl dehydratase